jgi:hypothetical protein
MQFHLERRLRLHTDSEYKNLYSWAIVEIDAQGRKVGQDQIPWPWTLRFSAKSSELSDTIEIKKTSDEQQAAQRHVIRIPLRPSSSRDDGDFFRETTFSMFGTDRTIKNFQLDIHRIADSTAEQESCRAWGSVSYTTEIDFRNETMEDCVVFYLFVSAETFARYAAKIAHGLVDEIILSVGSVAGFYSEWSPSISTRSIKVLTGGSEQSVTMPSGHQFELHKLGHVGDVQLEINRRIEFRKQEVDPDSSAAAEDVDTSRLMSDALPKTNETQMLRTLASLRKAAWLIASLLMLILIVSVLKN